MLSYTQWIDWRSMPLARIAMFFSAGVVAARWFGTWPVLSGLAVCGALLVLFAALHLQRTGFARRVNTYVLLLLTAVVGSLFYTMHDETVSDIYIGTQTASSFAITLQQRPVQTAKGFKVMAQVTAADGRVAKGGVWAYFETDSDLLVGAKLVCRGSMREITNKEGSEFDYAGFCRNKHITHQLFVSDFKLVSAPSWYNPCYQADLLLESALGAIERHVPAGEVQSVGKAMLLGDKSDLDETVSAQYRDAGASHILVVSGMHLGVLWICIAWLLNLIPIKSPWWIWCRWILMVAILWMAALIAGAGGSVVRAATMFTFLSFGKTCSFLTNSINILAASVLALLMYDSFLLFDVGFLLSYAAVLGILVFYPLIYKLVYCREWLLDKAWQLTAVGLAAQLGTMPVTLTAFGTIPVYFIFSGLTAVPLSSAALLSGLGLLVTDAIGFGSSVVAYLFYTSVWAMNASVALVQGLPGRIIEGCYQTGAQALLLTSSLVVLAWALQHKQLRLWNFTLLLVVLWLGSFYIN
jgi:competence protein ComEC